MAARQRILIVDDDRRMCGFVTKFLEREGFAAEFALNGAGMREAIAAGMFNLIILDLTFPDGDDGITLARSLRACSETPLIMLSGKCEIIDKIVCLEIGADDYLTKPFEPRELLARIRTILRRSQTRETTRRVPGATPDKLACFYGFSCDLDGQTLAGPDGVNIPLTGQELRLLTALVQRPGRVLTRDQILDLIAHRQWAPLDRSVDVLVGKLRRKLGDHGRHAQMIRTVRGEGYVFIAPLDFRPSAAGAHPPRSLSDAAAEVR
jgi:two-component system, OmpR family, response regulator